MAWSLDDGDTKTWEELLYHGSSFLYLEDPDVNQAIVDVWDAGQASWEICEVHAPTNQEHDAPPDESNKFYWPDEEKEKYTEHEIQDIERMIEGLRLFRQLLRKEITMKQFMDEYIPIRTELVDTFVDNQEHDAPPDDSNEFYWPDEEKEKYTEHEIQDIERMIEGLRLFGQLLRKEITMRQFMDEYIPIRTELVDTFVDKFYQRDAHRI